MFLGHCSRCDVSKAIAFTSGRFLHRQLPGSWSNRPRATISTAGLAGVGYCASALRAAGCHDVLGLPVPAGCCMHLGGPVLAVRQQQLCPHPVLRSNKSSCQAHVCHVSYRSAAPEAQDSLHMPTIISVVQF